MSDAELLKTAEGEDADWIATLTRGSTYTLGVNPETSKRFNKGVETPITDATKVRLEEKACDMIDTKEVDEDDLPVLEPKCKFNFRRVGEPAKQPARRRVRPA